MRHGVDEAATDEWLSLTAASLPQPNHVPSFTQAKTLIEKLSLKPGLFFCGMHSSQLIFAVLYEACANDCVVYTGLLREASMCHVCQSSRYKDDSKPAKVFRYMPIIPQLKNLFASSHTAEHVRWAAEHKYDPSEVRDITESSAFDELIRKRLFSIDARNLALAVCTDGVQPWSGSNYDLWPIFVTVLNLPPHLRDLPENAILVGLIPGRSAPQHINTYLRFLVWLLSIFG